jgi:hypothetical protein
VTDTLAIYGAVVSTIAVGWNVYRDVYQRSRGPRKKLTLELYSPVRRQLVEASEAIQKHGRATSVNYEMWKVAHFSGIASKLKPALRLALEDLYERKLPSYEKSWQELNKEVGRLVQEWDERYADIHDFQTADKEHHIVKVEWLKFLTESGPATPIDGLREGDVLRLWNAFMTPARFKLLDLSAEQFLIKRWEEAARSSAMQHFRQLRKQVLDDIPKAIALLDKNSSY